VGLENPCSPKDYDLFVVAMVATIANGEKALFLESSWLEGMCPRDIASKSTRLQGKEDAP
jgi:hypothetical protein